MQRKRRTGIVECDTIVYEGGAPVIVRKRYEYPDTYNIEDVLKKFRKETCGAKPLKVFFRDTLYKMEDTFFYDNATIDSETVEEVEF